PEFDARRPDLRRLRHHGHVDVHRSSGLRGGDRLERLPLRSRRLCIEEKDPASVSEVDRLRPRRDEDELQTVERDPVVAALRDAIGEGRLALPVRSEEHTSELQSLAYLVCRLLLEKKKIIIKATSMITNNV